MNTPHPSPPPPPTPAPPTGNSKLETRNSGGATTASAARLFDTALDLAPDTDSATPFTTPPFHTPTPTPLPGSARVPRADEGRPDPRPIQNPQSKIQNTFGHFDLEKELGRGGMGIVYRAREHASGRLVALKMLHLMHLQTPDMIRRFDTEVRVVATLDHPNIMPVYEVGQYDGIPYFSMKLAEHGSLSRKIRATKIPPRAAAALLAKLARALLHAHQRGVMHRDLKPANILLDADDEPYIADFGIAKITNEHALTTASTLTLGTPAYLAPELIHPTKKAPAAPAQPPGAAAPPTENCKLKTENFGSGDGGGGAAAITTAADIYGLGAILYELLATRPPYTGKTPADIIRQIIKSPPPDPRTHNPAIDDELSAICMKCLAPDPADRYLSASTLAEDLDNYLANRPVLARPPTRLGVITRWCRREPLLATLAAGIVVLLIGIGIASTTFAINYAAQRNRARAAETNAQEQLYQSLLNQTRLGRQTGLAGQRYKGLEALRQAAAIRVTPEVRNEAAALLALTDIRPARTLRVRPEQSHPIAFDPTLTRYLTTTDDRNLTLRRSTDNTELARYPGTGESILGIAAFSADGRYTATRHYDGAIRVWDTQKTDPAQALALELTDRVPRARAYGTTRIWFGCAFSTDSKYAAIELPDGGYTLHDLADHGRELARYPGPPGSLALSFSPAPGSGSARVPRADEGRPDPRPPPTPALPPGAAAPTENHKLKTENSGEAGYLLAIANRATNTAEIRDPLTGRLHHTLTHPGPVVSLTWSPDGSTLAVCCLDSNIYLWDTATGQLRRTLTAHRLSVMQAAYTSDGHLLASTSQDRTIILWNPESGTRLVTLPGYGYEPILRFSQDGHHLVTGDFKPDATILEITTGDDICRTYAPEGRANIAVVTAGIDFSPDSNWLVTSTRDTIHLWDLQNHRHAAALHPSKTPTETSALFTPDGTALLVATRYTGLDRYPFNPTAHGSGSARVPRADEGRPDPRPIQNPSPLGEPTHLFTDRYYTLSDYGPANTRYAILTNRSYGAVILWPLTPADKPIKFQVQNEAWDAALTPDGKTLATTCAAQGDRPGPRILHLWDVATGRKLRTIDAGAAGLVRFTPDGTRLLVSSPNNAFCIYDTATWQSTGDTPVNDELFTFNLSRDGRYLCTPVHGEVWLYQGPDYHEPVIELSPPGDASLTPRSAFNRDGTLLAIHEADGIVHLWNLKTLRAKLAALHLDWPDPQPP